MKPEPTRKQPIRVRVLSEAREEVDSAALWLDDSIEAEELIRLDPLDVAELEAFAERPELADYVLQSIPKQGYSERTWGVVWRDTKRELQAKNGGGETPAALAARIRGSK